MMITDTAYQTRQNPCMAHALPFACQPEPGMPHWLVVKRVHMNFTAHCISNTAHTFRAHAPSPRHSEHLQHDGDAMENSSNFET